MEDRPVHKIIEDVLKKNNAKGGPFSTHQIVYNSPSETLEPVYFFLLDLVESFGYDVEKLSDNFTSTPGSGHFADLGQRATKMQEEGMKILGSINTVIRSIVNLLYDLKEWRIRLQQYDDYHSKDRDKKFSAVLALKQIWLDKVDINKGQSSVKAMALGQAGFQTLLDGFFAADDEKAVDKIDLNDRVKRILKQRIHEFLLWIDYSEQELRKRYSIERSYLKSQLSSLKLYSRWARPYIKAAIKLEQKEQGRKPRLVDTFNSILLELTLLGKKKVDIKSAITSGDLPVGFDKMKNLREYYSIVLLDYEFNGIPQRGQQGQYLFGGKVIITFRSYALNKDELEMIDRELEKSDIAYATQIASGVTDESLEQIQADVEFFLNEESVEHKKEEGGANPFLALFGYYDKEKKKEGEKEEKKKILEVRKENWAEREHMRKAAEKPAKEDLFSFFDIYKKAHGMVSYT
jgi:hypothetical protein